MRYAIKIAAGLLALAAPFSTQATVGGAHYQPQYDFDELRAFTDNKPVRVEIVGNPFPGIAVDDAARQMLPMIQAARPMRLRSIFTYDKPAELPRPDYRLVLVFDAANDLGSASVCRGVARHKPATPGKVNIYAVYCRNDQPMSETTGWTDASSPGDASVAKLYFDLLSTVFSDAQGLRPQNGGGDRR